MSPYKDGPAHCPTCGAPTHYEASGDTESQGYFGTHRFVGCPRPHLEVETNWWARMEYLFRDLPFSVRHRWGGDAREMVEGIDFALNREARRQGGGT